jgi:hypothetical protein
MNEVRVKVEKNPVQIYGGVGSICNFQVAPVDYDLGDAVGNGATLEEALQDFEASYECKFDEEVNAIIVEKVNF